MIFNDSAVPPGLQRAKHLTFKRLIGRTGGLVWGLLLLAGTLGTIDRLYWINADTYPSWRAEDLTITEQVAKSHNSYGSVCVEGHAELMQKQNGNFMRCAGNLFSIKTYRVTNYQQVSAWLWDDVGEAN